MAPKRKAAILGRERVKRSLINNEIDPRLLEDSPLSSIATNTPPTPAGIRGTMRAHPEPPIDEQLAKLEMRRKELENRPRPSGVTMDIDPETDAIILARNDDGTRKTVSQPPNTSITAPTPIAPHPSLPSRFSYRPPFLSPRRSDPSSSPGSDSDATISNTPARRIQATIESTPKMVLMPCPPHLKYYREEQKERQLRYPPDLLKQLEFLKRIRPNSRSPQANLDFLAGQDLFTQTPTLANGGNAGFNSFSEINPWDSLLAADERLQPRVAITRERGAGAGYQKVNMEGGGIVDSLNFKAREELEKGDPDCKGTSYSTAASVLQSLRKDVPKVDQRKLEKIRASWSQKPLPFIQDLALGQLQRAKDPTQMEAYLFRNQNEQYPSLAEDTGCSFCQYGCDFGVADDRCFLPEEASPGYCYECYYATSQAEVLWDELMKALRGKHSKIELANGVILEPGRLGQLIKGHRPSLSQYCTERYSANVSAKYIRGSTKVNMTPDDGRVSEAITQYHRRVALTTSDMQKKTLASSSIGETSLAARPTEGRLESFAATSIQMEGVEFQASRSTISRDSAKQSSCANVVFQERSHNAAPHSSPVQEARQTKDNTNGEIGRDMSSNGMPPPGLTGLQLDRNLFPIQKIPGNLPSSSQPPVFHGSAHSNQPVSPQLVGQLAPQQGSSSETQNNFVGPSFCRGNPYRQLDVIKTRICETCRGEKYRIATHRHSKFEPISMTDTFLSFNQNARGGLLSREHKLMHCMVCFNNATCKCVGCELTLCEGCEMRMLNICKGSMNLLVSLFMRGHIRNDAFLLRSDNLGY